DRRGTESRLLQDFHHNVLPMARPLLTGGGNQNVLVPAAVVGHHKRHALFFKNAPHHHIGGTLQHLDDNTYASSLCTHAVNPYHGDIAIEHSAHLPGMEINIALAIFRD